MSLHIVPYGNARGEYSKDGVTCQHGSDECTTNMIEACAIHLAGGDSSFDKSTGWWPFFLCMEKKEGSPSAAKGCAADSGLKYSDIMDCASSDLGKQLIDANAEETGNLQPAHKYVPWVLIDDKLKGDGDLLQQLCAAYKGSDTPACCSQENLAAEVAPASDRCIAATEVLSLFKPTLRLVGGNPTHYGDPKSGCMSDEVSIQIQGLQGDACVPECTSTACPTDVPTGATAKPQCALQDASTKKKYCALLCSPSTAEDALRTGDAQCGDNASCKPISGVGICTYDD